MGKVKPQSVLVDTGSRLLHMSTQHSAERFLKKMGCAVVSRRKGALLRIYLEGNFVSCFDHAFCHHANMADLPAQEFYGVFNLELSLACADISGVGLLTAACRIERCLVDKDSAFLPLGKCVNDLVFCCEYSDARFISQVLISDERTCHAWIDGLIYRHVSAHVVCDFPGFPRFLSLHFHACMEPVLVHSQLFLLQDLFCQIQRKAVRVIEPEGVFTI